VGQVTAVNPTTGSVTVKYAVNGGCDKNVSTEYVSPHFLDVVDSVVGGSGGRSGGRRGSKRKQRRCAECDGVATTRWHDVADAEGGALAGVVLCSDCHTQTEVAARATPPRKARNAKARNGKARNAKARNAKAARRVRANTWDAVPANAPEKKTGGGAGSDAGEAGGQGAASGPPPGDDDDGGAKCAVCESGAWSAPNPILLCDGILANGSGEEYECPGAAHLRCCGMGEVPAEDVEWLCWSCCDVPTPGKRRAAALVGQPAGEGSGVSAALLVGASGGGGWRWWRSRASRRETTTKA
jgi:hypothetical protein